MAIWGYRTLVRGRRIRDIGFQLPAGFVNKMESGAIPFYFKLRLLEHMFSATYKVTHPDGR